MKQSVLLVFVLAFVMFSCGGKKESPTTTSEPVKEEATKSPDGYDPKRGEGKFDESNVSLGALNNEMASKGEAVAGTKCLSCHKLTSEKLVGPGWKGVTERRTPHWIMNFITNPDPMITKDPELQAQLEICLVRMPNQNLVDEEARNILEFIRKNDGIK